MVLGIYLKSSIGNMFGIISVFLCFEYFVYLIEVVQQFRSEIPLILQGT